MIGGIGNMFVAVQCQNVKVMQSQKSVGKRPSRLSQGSQVSTQCSECQIGEKLKVVNL